jgi:hypothetical protein
MKLTTPVFASLLLLTSSASAADSFNGTLVQGMGGCTLIETVDGQLLIPDDGGGGFPMGAQVHVTGDLDPSCASICFATDGCIWNSVTTGGWTVDTCGTLIQDAFGCVLLELPSGERYIPDDGGGGFPVGTTLRVRGDLDPGCGSICGANDGCILNATSTLDCSSSVVGIAYCFCDGSGTSSPCGNPGAAANGCANSSGASGANLSALGDPRVSASSLTLRGAGTPANQPGLFFQGEVRTNGGLGAMFGDGLRCTGGNVVRLEVVAPDANGDSTSSVDLALEGSVNGGETLYYQLWYRDPFGSPCGAFFNTTNALEVTWGY